MTAQERLSSTLQKYTSLNKPEILQNLPQNRFFKSISLPCRTLNGTLYAIGSNLANLGANWLVGGEKKQKEFNETVSVRRLKIPSRIRSDGLSRGQVPQT
jgi:hypothetical protein